MVFKCKNCGFGTVEPKFNAIDYLRLYPSSYYGETKRKSFINDIEKFFTKVSSLLRVRRIRKSFTKARLLDYGCGNGRFLQFLEEKGWDVYGIEPSKNNIETYTQTLNQRVFSNLEELNSRNKFDLITLWHVLEHLLEPTIIIKRIGEYLTPNGLLFIAIPNFDSIQSKFGRNKCFHLDVPRHIFHFTPNAIRLLLKRNNFEVIYINYFCWLYNTVSWVQTILNFTTVDTNFLFNILKRKIDYRKRIPLFRYIYNWIIILVFLPFLLPVCFILSIFFSFLRKSSTIEILAKRIG